VRTKSSTNETAPWARARDRLRSSAGSSCWTDHAFARRSVDSGKQALRFPAELGQDLRNHSCRELIREPFLQTVALKDHVAEVHTQ
jgi:hypothetical protein